MTINTATSGASGATVNGTGASQSTSSSSLDKLASEDTFLKLFVSQLKNQDPLNPADGTQFVSQLAQFSELEQVMNINQNIGAIRNQVVTPTAAGAAAAENSSSNANGVSGANQAAGSNSGNAASGATGAQN